MAYCYIHKSVNSQPWLQERFLAVHDNEYKDPQLKNIKRIRNLGAPSPK